MIRYSKKEVGIIILTKNEAQGLRRIIQSVKPYGNEIIVVDGNSTDNSESIARAEGVLFLRDHGLGRGDGLRIGIRHAKSQALVFFDADGSHEASDIPRIVVPVLQKKADMVICSRRTGGSFDLSLTLIGLVRSFGSDILTMIVNYAFKTNLTDILYSFRAVNRKAALKMNLQANDFCIEQEMVVSCLQHKMRLLEIPSREKARAWGKAKLQTMTGITFLFHLFYIIYVDKRA